MPRKDDIQQACRRRLNPRFQIIESSLSDWWTSFHRRWQGCSLCPLSACRNNYVVHFRGKLPAPVLLIGEAPGISEDEIGRPFVGPAGLLLDELLEESGLEDGDFCIINTVGCVPLDDEGKTRSPENAEIKACSPRTSHLITVCKPKLVCLLGRIASAAGIDRYCPQAPVIELPHPASMLPGRSKNPELARKRFTLTLQEALVEITL